MLMFYGVSHRFRFNMVNSNFVASEYPEFRCMFSYIGLNLFFTSETAVTALLFGKVAILVLDFFPCRRRRTTASDHLLCPLPQTKTAKTVNVVSKY